MRRMLPLLLLLAVLAVAWGLGWHRALSWQALGESRAALSAAVAARPAAAAAAYVGVYAAAVAVSLPGAAVITAAGGLLFGAVLGTALAVAGATIGAVVLFLAARSALGPVMAARAGPWLARLRPQLERDGFSYLLALRLIPVVPFWLVNLAAALVGMRLLPFAVGTLVGIVPGGAVFAAIGAGLGHVLDAGGAPDLSVVLSAPVLLPLLGLAGLALLPVLWRRMRHG